MSLDACSRTNEHACQKLKRTCVRAYANVHAQAHTEKNHHERARKCAKPSTSAPCKRAACKAQTHGHTHTSNPNKDVYMNVRARGHTHQTHTCTYTCMPARMVHFMQELKSLHKHSTSLPRLLDCVGTHAHEEINKPANKQAAD